MRKALVLTVSLLWAGACYACGAPTNGASTKPGMSQPTIGGGGEGQVAALPVQVKGYELYAWRDGAENWFTLITGTNRPKLLNEVVVKNANMVREQDGWVVVSVDGADALRRLVARIPQSTEVVLQNVDGLPPISNDVRETALQILNSR